MKRILSLILLSCMTLLCSCNADIQYKGVEITSVESLIAPSNNYYLELQSTAGVTFSFNWSPATAEDGYGVQYEIVFFTKDGQEIYRSDAGMSTSLSLGHKEVNRIAAAAGIDSGETGELKWSIATSRGANTLLSEEVRTLFIKRLMGFTYVPSTLYLVGDATENNMQGSRFVPKNLIKWKAGALNTLAGDEGEFEIFTSLQTGSYFFVEGHAADSKSWGVEDGLLSESPTPVIVTEPGIYHITVDFNVRGYIIKKITSVRYNKGGGETEMDYLGGSKWGLSLPVESGDDRYNFRLYEDGNSYPWSALGNVVWDQSSSTSSTDTSGPNFNIYITPYTDIPSGQLDWQPTFKWLKANMNFPREVILDLSGFDAAGNVTQYTHSYTVID